MKIKKLGKGIRKFIRWEKARIRHQVIDRRKQTEEIKKLLQRFYL